MNTKKTTPAAEPTVRRKKRMQSASSNSLYPDREGFAPRQSVPVGGVILADEAIEYNTGRSTASVTVRNTGDRPIQVGSHFHFFEVNRYLEFDRDAAFGCHLNIPATTAIRFEPGDQKQVELVAYAGKRRVIGFNGLTKGYTGIEDRPVYYPAHMRALRRMRHAGFKSTSACDAEAAAKKAQPENNDNAAQRNGRNANRKQ